MTIALGVEFASAPSSLHGNDEAGRRVLVQALKDPNSRKAAIAFVQKAAEAPMPSEFVRKMSSRMEALKAERVLLAEIAPYGRVLPFSSNEGAPREK